MKHFTAIPFQFHYVVLSTVYYFINEFQVTFKTFRKASYSWYNKIKPKAPITRNLYSKLSKVSKNKRNVI